MAKISMTIPDEELSLIDEYSGGNRTAFMVAAALTRARALQRERIDAEITAGMDADPEGDYAVYKELEYTMNDGLEDVE
jgi:hypothetical protein